MDLNVLELIYNECNETRNEPEGVIAFNEKYIEPLREQNPEECLKMKAMFVRALTDYDIRAFKNGFKACMNLIINCFNDKAEI